MKRRDFIRQSSIAGMGLAAGAGLLTSCNSRVKHITILHTNDLHSHIDPIDSKDTRNPNKGGVTRRAALVQAIRKENPNTLLLDAGDIFQGTPYFNYYGGELDFKLMSMMGYDAATIGNHDFDNGIEGLYAQLPHASFSFLSSNYNFKNTIMDGHTLPYKIFLVDGLHVGVFGLGIELKGLVDPRMYRETVYLDPIGVTEDIVSLLRNEKKCELIICLSHLGYKYADPQRISDVTLAGATKGIDLIIGGHTHTFLDEPVEVKNKEGHPVIINQVGCYGINLGRIDFFYGASSIIQGESIGIG